MKSDEVLFSESYAAAQSLKNFWTRLASTYGCIVVVLSPKMLTIKPHWFAHWIITPLGLDLIHEIPITRITSVIETGAWFGYGIVKVHYRDTTGAGCTIVLYMKKHHEFVDKAADVVFQRA